MQSDQQLLRFLRKVGFSSAQRAKDGQAYDWAFGAEDTKCSPLTFLMRNVDPSSVYSEDELTFSKTQLQVVEAWQGTGRFKKHAKEALDIERRTQEAVKEQNTLLSLLEDLDCRHQRVIASTSGLQWPSSGTDPGLAQTLDAVKVDTCTQIKVQSSILAEGKALAERIAHKGVDHQAASQSSAYVQTTEIEQLQSTVRLHLEKQQVKLQQYHFNGALYQAPSTNKLAVSNQTWYPWNDMGHIMGHVHKNVASLVGAEAELLVVDALRFQDLNSIGAQLEATCHAARRKQLDFFIAAHDPRQRRDDLSWRDMKQRSTSQIEKLGGLLQGLRNPYDVDLARIVVDDSSSIQQNFQQRLHTLRQVAFQATAIQALLSLMLGDVGNHTSARTAAALKQVSMYVKQLLNVQHNCGINLDARRRWLSSQQIFQDASASSFHAGLDCVLETFRSALRSLRTHRYHESRTAYAPDLNWAISMAEQLFRGDNVTRKHVMHVLLSQGTEARNVATFNC